VRLTSVDLFGRSTAGQPPDNRQCVILGLILVRHPRLRACRKRSVRDHWMQAGKTVEATLPSNLCVQNVFNWSR
jgi:hypothetical protein